MGISSHKSYVKVKRSRNIYFSSSLSSFTGATKHFHLRILQNETSIPLTQDEALTVILKIHIVLFTLDSKYCNTFCLSKKFEWRTLGGMECIST